jgi:YVTN family beta-propeller protein
MSGHDLTAASVFTVNHQGSVSGGSEVVAYDAARNLVFVLGPNGVDVLDAADGSLAFTLPRDAVTQGGTPLSLGGGNSVAVHGDLLAVAYGGPERAQNGAVALYRLAGDGSGATLERVVQPTDALGAPASFAVPDMVTFTPDGTKLLVAIEGEPADNYASDPLGGIGIIDVATGELSVAGFGGFDAAALKAAGVRITGRADATAAAGTATATAAADLEPEYIAVSADGTKAYVTLQDNNALAIVDIATATVTSVIPFGLKDYNTAASGIDVSDRDGGPEIGAAAAFGMYQPDGIEVFEQGGRTFLVTANEGDAREWGDFVEPIRIADATLDPTAFPASVAAALKNTTTGLGRLEVSSISSDTDGDGDLDRLDVFGGRSFSIWEIDGNELTQVWDSGRQIDEILASQFPDRYDDGRSDNKGAEPEGLTLGMLDGELYAFVGLERANGIMAFRIDTSGADPTASYAGLIATDGDQAPEVFTYVPNADASSGQLYVANEVSGTTRAYTLDTAPQGQFTLQILHASDFEAGLAAATNAPNFAAIVDRLEDTYANSITLSSGDNYIPGPFLAASGDAAVRSALQSFYEQLLDLDPGSLSGLALAPARTDIAIMNALGVQAGVLGNHEFDLGPNVVADAIDMTAGTSGSTLGRITSIGALFPYLSANLDFSAEAALRGLFTDTLREASTYATTAADLASNTTVAAEAADAQIAPWTTIVENGETIGVLGLTTQLLRSISSTGNVQVKDPAGDGGINNTDELATILQPLVDQMTAQGIDKIILLSHLQQNSLEIELAAKLQGVDVIIAGGSHAVFADGTDTLRPGDTAARDYPVIVTGADGKPVAVVNTGGEYSYVGRLVVTFDENGVIIPESIEDSVSGAYATTEEVVQEVWGTTDESVYFADGTRGGEVKQLTDAVQAVINAKDGNIFGYSEIFLDGRRAEVRTEETNLGNLSADANLWAAQQSDSSVVVSLKNGGGIRAEIGAVVGQPVPSEVPPIANPAAGKPAGAVSQLDIENSLRFNNALSIATFSAANLVKVIENALAGVAPGATPGGFPQVGGLSFSFDATRAAGDRVMTLAVLNEDDSIRDVLVRNGELVGDAAREFRVVLLSFSLDGGDGWMNGVTFTDRVDLSTNASTAFEEEGREQQALADYLAATHATPEAAFDAQDTTAAGDTRIQNLAARSDEVLPTYHVTATDTSVDSRVEFSVYDGPVSYLTYEFAGSDNGEAVLGTAWNDFVHLGGGDDAADGGAGDDVLDGGTGSSFLTGGAGQDVFFVDGRSGATIWSTITDWQAGEQLALWGWDPGASQAIWVDDAGAEGYRGVTMHADLDDNGVIDTSITWAGLSRADLPTPIQQDGLLWFV